MATLPDNDRAALTAEYQRELSSHREAITVSKADLRAAINALDQFLHDNATAINNAIPQPARTQLTSRQKAQILVYVIDKRFKVL